jgi:hypothetical protein
MMPQKSPHVLPAVLGGIALVIVVVGRLIERYASGSAILEILLPLFDINGEANLPAWYSTLLWIIAAYYTLLISRHVSKGMRGQFLLLSALFLFLSFDEAASLHEKIGDIIVVSNGGKLHGIFHFEWVIAGLIFVALCGLVFIRLLLQLDRLVFLIIGIAAITYLTGALGLEMIQAAAGDGIPLVSNWLTSRLPLAEELFEMLGVAILIDGLLLLLTRIKQDTGHGSGTTIQPL